MYNQQSFRSGSQPQYQPVGQVQSYYQQPQTTGFQSQGGSGTASYHMAHYQGNQPGHDQYLRSDSSNPSQIQGQSFSSVYSGAIQSTGAYGSAGAGQSYHLANYRGNQPGHDQSLRSDSSQPSQMGAGQMSMQSAFGQTESYHLSNYRGNQPGHDQYLRSDSSRPSSGYGQQSQPGPMGQMEQMPMQSAFGQTESYHLSNYRGNQPGHDQYLRSDSSQPSGFGQQPPSGYR